MWLRFFEKQGAVQTWFSSRLNLSVLWVEVLRVWGRATAIRRPIVRMQRTAPSNEATIITLYCRADVYLIVHASGHLPIYLSRSGNICTSADQRSETTQSLCALPQCTGPVNRLACLSICPFLLLSSLIQQLPVPLSLCLLLTFDPECLCLITPFHLVLSFTLLALVKFVCQLLSLWATADFPPKLAC